MALVDELRDVVGDAGLVALEDADRFLSDWYDKYAGPAFAVVRPATTNEVAEVVALCHRGDVAVVPQGGNTGLVGGSVPLSTDHADGRDCILLSLSRMNNIVSIDAERATLTTEAGVTIQELQEAATRQGLLFGPDWGARGSAMVGGGISTNAGGLNVLRWGTMREQILGLEVVLPDGRIWNGLRALRKDSTGLDLKHLFIGTEGTLGVVTKAVFRLHPLPTVHQTAFVALTRVESLMDLYGLARAESSGLVSAFELLPEEGVRRVLGNLPQAQRPLEHIGEWYVLLRLSGGDEVQDTLADLLATAAEQELIIDAAVASTAEQERNLWLLREEVPAPFTFDERGNRHKFDLAIPVDRVVDFLAASAAAVEDVVTGTATFAFGHVGDGNLHFNIYPGPDCDVDQFDARGAELEGAIDELTWHLDGTISAEHGIGQTMRGRIVGQKSAVEFDLMHTVKAALDPKNTMNPGKLLPPPRNFSSQVRNPDLTTARKSEEAE